MANERTAELGELSPTFQTGITTREGQVIKMSYNKYPKEMKEAIITRLFSGEK